MLDIAKYIGAFLAGSGLFLFFVKLAANHIAKRLSRQYELQLNKELEDFKSKLASKNYVSKVRFDAEFQIYRDLNAAFSEMVMRTYFLFPTEMTHPADETERRERHEKDHHAAVDSIFLAQNALNKNAAFITEISFCKYKEIMSMCKEQERDFGIYRGLRVDIQMNEVEKGFLFRRGHNQTPKITNKHNELIEYLRKYLESLDVAE